jgi:hypothetical protein
MSRACDTHGEKISAFRVLLWKPEGKRPLGRRMLRREDNIKMDLKQLGWEAVHCIYSHHRKRVLEWNCSARSVPPAVPC